MCDVFNRENNDDESQLRMWYTKCILLSIISIHFVLIIQIQCVYIKPKKIRWKKSVSLLYHTLTLNDRVSPVASIFVIYEHFSKFLEKLFCTPETSLNWNDWLDLWLVNWFWNDIFEEAKLLLQAHPLNMMIMNLSLICFSNKKNKKLIKKSKLSNLDFYLWKKTKMIS